MQDDQSSIPDALRTKFPHLRPIKNPPTMVTMNGIGLTVFGKRDFDAETQTYVKTRCICLLFIPLFAIDAYRVADAGGRRWYFLAKDTLSSFARGWNYSMGCLVVLGALALAWNTHVNSPDYLARQQINRAAGLMQSGEVTKAAGVYREQLRGPEGVAAHAGFETAIQKLLDSDKPEQVAAGLRLAASGQHVVQDWGTALPDADKGLALVQKFRTANPAGALDILEAATELDPKSPALTAMHTDLLKEVVAANPDDVPHTVELAVLYEEGGQLDDGVKILRPLKSKLGDTEGARILGRKLLEEENYDDAYALLYPYVHTRLDHLHAVESVYTNTVENISRATIEELNNEGGPADFYASYKSAGSKEEKAALVDAYIQKKTENDPNYRRTLEDFKKANEIVPVALDLGIVQLNRAQGLKDPEARKTELEAAEKTFLAIRSTAGESDEYRLFLGQVYYWLGKSTEGRALFDQLLASRQRNFAILMRIGETLRNVGEESQSRAMTEEAYQAAKTDKQRYEAAILRALTPKDQDDRLAWLEKSDPKADWVQVELNQARGQKALQQGNKTLAAELLGKAIEGYMKEPKSSAQLNNCALACFDLFEATGNVADQQRGISMLEEAVAMDPSDSILLFNATDSLIRTAVNNVNHDTVNLAALHERAGPELLSFLYQDDTGRAKLYQQLQNDAAMKTALSYLDKALLLEPKNPEPYNIALALQIGFRNVDELQKLERRFQVAAPDLKEVNQGQLDTYTGIKNRQQLDRIARRIASLQQMATNPMVAGNPATADFLNVNLMGLQQQAWLLGADLNGEQLVQMAQANHQQHESISSLMALESAYFFKAHQALMSQDSRYAAIANKARRGVMPEYVMTLVLDRGGPLADVVANNPDFMRAVTLKKQDVALTPSWGDVQDWVLLRHVAPDTAGIVAQRLKQSDLMRTYNQLALELEPMSVSAVLDEYWMQEFLGDDKRAAEIFQSATAAGVPLPAL